MSASFIPADDGEYGRWQENLICSDGTVVTGCGATAGEAEYQADLRRRDHDNFLALPAAEQLKILVAGDLLDTDQRRAIRLLAELVLGPSGDRVIRPDVAKQLATLTKEFGIPKMPNIGCSASDIGG